MFSHTADADVVRIWGIIGFQIFDDLENLDDLVTSSADFL